MTHLPGEGAHVVYVVAKRMLYYIVDGRCWSAGEPLKLNKAFCKAELRAC